MAWIRRPHGVTGEVRAEPLGGDVERFSPGTKFIAEASGKNLTVVSVRRVGGGELLLRFAELPQREDAAQLTGDYLCAPLAEARPLGKDEWFVWQLVGLRACDPAGNEMGVVSDVEPGVGADVLVVRTPAGSRRFPMVSEYIGDVDLEAKEIVVTPLPEEEL